MLQCQDAGAQSSETTETSLSESRVARCRWERWLEERWDELQVKGNTWCEGPLLWTEGTACTNTRVLNGPGPERAHIAPLEPNRWCRAEDAWALNSVQVTSTFILWVAQGLLSEAIVLTSGEKPDPRQEGTPVSRLFRLENLAHKGSGMQAWKPEDGWWEWVRSFHQASSGIKFRLSSWAASTFTCWAVTAALRKFLTEIFSQRSLHVPVLLFLFF